jgi:hypothetical protein
MSRLANVDAAADEAALRRQVIAKVSRRLIPFLMAMFCLNTLDRVTSPSPRCR